MMGQALFTVDVPVCKTSSALTCFTKDQVAAFEPTACIQGGRCVSVCLPYRSSHDDESSYEP